MNIIGIDCATQPGKTGLALGEWDGRNCRILEVAPGSRSHSPVDITLNWLTDVPALIALDAPLGWPIDMGRRLSNHQAGDPIVIQPDSFFSRETDRFVREKISKRPLEVGAARIARTAHASLEFLRILRIRTGLEIPLAWDPDIQQTSVIEVYPAATLISHRIKSEGYKRKDQAAARKEILTVISKLLQIPENFPGLENNADILDAVICILAGVDFLRGDVYIPDDLDKAVKEGWIWVYSG